MNSSPPPQFQSRKTGILTDDYGNPSSGRVATLATVFTGCGLMILIAVGEWNGKDFSDSLFITSAAMAVGGGGVKALQKISERKPVAPVYYPPQPPVNPQPSAGYSGQIPQLRPPEEVAPSPLERIRERGQL